MAPEEVPSTFICFINPKINPMTPIKTSLILTCCLALAAVPCAFAGPNAEHSADAMFKSMDTDGDGRISRAEHAASAKKMFDKMDANHDGIVTAAEMDAFHAMKTDKPGKDGMSSADKIKAMDTNGDGQLSQAEHEAGSDAMFTKMDTNNDGFLSPAEFTAGHAGMMKHKMSAN
jgi:Ca2+-binding EF-hand superfamily protein